MKKIRQSPLSSEIITELRTLYDACYSSRDKYRAAKKLCKELKVEYDYKLEKCRQFKMKYNLIGQHIQYHINEKHKEKVLRNQKTQWRVKQINKLINYLKELENPQSKDAISYNKIKMKNIYQTLTDEECEYLEAKLNE